MIISIDQGTTSSRVLVLNDNLDIIESQQRSHKQISTQPGWLEHDPEEIFTNIQYCLTQLQQYEQDIKCCGITNQRETVICWDKYTGRPLHNAIVWCDTRTQDLIAVVAKELEEQNIDIKQITGLPVSTYFTGMKIRWLIENIQDIAQAVTNKTCIFGTIDAYLIFKLSQYDKPQFKTDVSNASRTLLLNLQTLDYDDRLLKIFKVNRDVLPTIHPSGSNFCAISIYPFKGIKITAVLGDQQAALYGHKSFQKNDAMCTFGTGAFLLVNSGQDLVLSKDYITTIFYQKQNQQPQYALEGSVTTAGAAFEFLKNLKVIDNFEEIDSALLIDTPVSCLPALSGLLAPFWASNARFCFKNISVQTFKPDLIKSVAEGICLQIKRVCEDFKAKKLTVGGGVTKSGNFCQLLGSICQIQVIKGDTEATAIGAGRLAGETLDIQFQDQNTKTTSYEPKSWVQKDSLNDLVHLSQL
ncbi:Glycerol kinase [Spironucleus salmonicida]|uniref:glycerol kinase n=1 Tax=Spironucleus salmonicida TaxID=348837 RepID=V6LJL4_9EUKA|nr:Glycerol kinase [Spironucleus salmonicida]|eukprot:EST43906.1 Glycerol kinase [Spironucleus salmonicida]